ncbi:putative nuclease HARBI1 [Cheilinus undulatus]|uniref:putative nuclease HARBI1 n=1 Tax=Cheilinus undulatus TaxID=241271 RepID=UPI001BD43203|nr:putative nuclease HARBI1 [Cheilinus undulatus]
MARPFLEDVLDEEALIIRRAFGRERVFRDRSDPLVFGDDYLIERYRFCSDGLKYLCRLLGPEIQHQTVFSHALTVPWMVSVTVRFLASGSFLYSVGDAENLNKGTIHLAVRRVCLALKSLIHIFITFPGHRRLLYIKEDFYKIAAFPKVIGAVDCTHIRIQRPSGEHEGDYVNRKSFHSISVQMICDANCLVSDLEAKWPESVHDSRVFRAKKLCILLLGEFSGVLLGDKGYTCESFLLTPLADPQTPQQAYNNAHSKTRASTEMTFGLLKSRMSYAYGGGGGRRGRRGHRDGSRERRKRVGREGWRNDSSDFDPDQGGPPHLKGQEIGLCASLSAHQQLDSSTLTHEDFPSRSGHLDPPPFSCAQ